MILRKLIAESPGTTPTMTIEENVALAYSRNKGRGLRIGVDKKRREFFKESLEMLGLNLENRLSAKVGLLSGGERQALSLLMATFTKPSILLLDEHTAALDPSRAELITQITKYLVEKDKLTTLMVFFYAIGRLSERLVNLSDNFSKISISTLQTRKKRPHHSVGAKYLSKQCAVGVHFLPADAFEFCH